ncbi:DNA repair protein RadC [Alphaproteobacteria bacterium]|nr:DNA repair protein RadC [Alphaproteobacteria bacterium]
MEGVGETTVCLLKICQHVSIQRLKAPIMQKPLLDGWDQVATYCKAQMSHLQKEQLRTLFVDHKNQLLHDEVHREGTVDQAPLYIREILQRALDLGATGLILVHNHPTGDPTPSAADIAVTRNIQEAAKHLNIRVLDHLIIGKGRHISLKAQGMM